MLARVRLARSLARPTPSECNQPWQMEANVQSKDYENGFRDGWQDAAVKVLPALRLALDRLEVSNYDNDEAESIAAVTAAIAELAPFVEGGAA